MKVDFTQKMLAVLLPAVKRMVEKQEKHLIYLKQHYHPEDPIIAQEEWYLSHYKQRQKEYEDYCLKNW